tara:strand:+ start:138 stop:485 length:348 start_codon:yes stop_codon:yes gene_type:complete
MKTWSCIDSCGACCKFDLSERTNLNDKLSRDDITLIGSMTSKDGWCKHLDRSNKKCLIYENRPHFCNVKKFSMSFKEYSRFGDEFLIDCCKQHISSNYGSRSKVMKRFKIATENK